MSHRETVLGIGGFFFRSGDPDGIADWYERVLGVAAPPASYEERSWWQDGGPTIWAAFPDEPSPHIGPAGWGVNLRVRDLDAMVAQLRAAGEQVDVDPQTYPNGRFAALHDPAGNPVQLWQPAGTDAQGPA